MKKSLYVILCALIILSCDNKATNAPVNTKPALPSAETMQIPTLENIGTPKSANSLTVYNIGIAKSAVYYWSITTTAAIAIPAAFFNLAVTATPTVTADNTGWQWTVSNDSASAVIVGKVKGDSVTWTINVTCAKLALQNFLWISGSSVIAGNSGYWVIYDASGAKYRFTYLISTPVTSDSIEFKNISTDSRSGSYLTYTSHGTVRTMIVNATEVRTSYKIIWDSVTGSGSLLQNNVTKICWDTKANNYQDITCP